MSEQVAPFFAFEKKLEQHVECSRKILEIGSVTSKKVLEINSLSSRKKLEVSV